MLRRTTALPHARHSPTGDVVRLSLCDGRPRDLEHLLHLSATGSVVVQCASCRDCRLRVDGEAGASSFLKGAGWQRTVATAKRLQLPERLWLVPRGAHLYPGEPHPGT